MLAITKLFEKERLQKEECRKNLPRVVAAKRIKYLRAIGKDELIDNANNISMDDENLPLLHLKQPFLALTSEPSPTIFDDSVVITEFNKLKRPEFDIKAYLKAAKWILFCWLGDIKDIFDICLHNTLRYALAYARNFDRPSENMFTFSNSGTEEIKLYVEDDTVKGNLPGNSDYIKSLNALLNDLDISFDETKYRKLNLNITYLILLLARRSVKSDKEFEKAINSPKTSEDYRSLCPYVLGRTLPGISKICNDCIGLKDAPFLQLVLYGYLQSKGLTKKIYRITCINHMENNGIALWKLFNDVTRHYNVESYKLWDLLAQYEKCCLPLFALADLAHIQNEMLNSDPPKSFKLFPFCRLINQCYHCDLASKRYTNTKACYVLACLVDLKLGYDKSSARNAHWTKDLGTIAKSGGEQIAKVLFEKLNEG